jgi:hypothetical protein
MYGVVTRGSKGETVYNDRYRCEGKDFAGNACRCGVEFTPKSFVIPERLKYLTESDEGRRQLIEMIDRGEVSGLEYKPK